VTLGDLPDTFFRVVAAIFGLLWGSFLNVVIYRVPRGMSVVSPPSHCPSCKKPIRPWQNVPFFGWIFLRGKTACCGEKLSFRYPMVELIGGVISVAVLELIVLPPPHATTSLGYAGAVYAASFALAMGLIATAFIDLEHMVVLPDKANAAGAILGVATASFRELGYLDAILGGAIGFGSIWGINRLYLALRGRTGMASGDGVLLGVLGCWFGWKGALFSLMAGAVQGTLFLIVARLVGGKHEEPEAVREEREEILKEIEALPEDERDKAMEEWRAADELADGVGEGWQQALAFGPFLALAGLELLLFSPWIHDLVFLWQLD
jgi:leader peptidase (prepilin peptidase)/N-methyltransferase